MDIVIAKERYIVQFIILELRRVLLESVFFFWQPKQKLYTGLKGRRKYENLWWKIL